ncbi:MAG: DNA mismatch repair endonuclease MutL [Candidatus Lokiarchaeota archaeon]|nr:DNA mismatch repair endonuclease MutL [Candidatus Lokiarchaeota archaeon]
MRPKIQKLQDADKIAAGEVVERPANIVKELVENSIDSGANEIRILVKKAGKSSIQVIDNGIGIHPDEIELAFQRYTSSKIRTIQDLENLTTLGFRGEALASIAAVSEVEVTSKIKNLKTGVRLSINGGIITERKEVSCPIGVNIKINNLFYNTPARQKFLKKDNTELGHITDIIQRYSLAYPSIHFIYLNNDLTILNCPASNDLKTTAFHIYGKKVAQALEEIKHDEPNFNLFGLIGGRDIAKKSRSQSSFFLNRRYIISDLLYRAVQEAYKGTLMISTFPFFILYLEIDPSIVDFNVHPKKLEVRFEDEQYIHNKVYSILRGFIEEKYMKAEELSSTDLKSYISTDKTMTERKVQDDQDQKIDIEPIMEKSVQLQITDHIQDNKEGIPEAVIREKHVIAKNFPKLRLISKTGQLSNKIYVVLEGVNQEGESGMYLLDQHAASERITKEYFIEQYESSKKSRQALIIPLTVEVSPSEKFFLLSNINEIKKLGFDFEHFGGNTFILREIPVIVEKTIKANIIKNIISDITEIGKDRSFSEVKEKIINYLACHKSVRGGDDLNLNDIRKLITELSKQKDPYHCAHGRPTLKFISFKEMDKLFKRLG